ncbi:4,5-dihydroxyphthalate decarboxylase [Chitinasiproducens palmae]|uniref:4,5-dihydroxyphthalate decarboxylase n=2 Tax=Chitinasiproducens palmae TaxID=1770053 RepID=A0A1H2PTZ0_9BURK|nr:4,5-dihydroxyphthalate decarboxylase [Chitinasiproducens palmae]
MDTPARTRLSAMMGTYGKTRPLKDGTLQSPLLELAFAPVDTAQKAFKDVVRREQYDVSELAIITYLQAFEAGKPYLLLPFVMNGNFHHGSVWCRDDATFGPTDLAGKRVAMRAYTQTTPTWVRGLLADEYGMRLEEVRWLSQEGAHVEGYDEPPWVSRLDPGTDLETLLRTGEVDAIIAGGGLSKEPGIRPLLDAPADAAARWYARTGIVPINHVVTIRQSVADGRPDLVRELYGLLLESRTRDTAYVPAQQPDLQPTGFEALAPALTLAVRYAYEQRLIKRMFSLGELYGSVRGALA